MSPSLREDSCISHESGLMIFMNPGFPSNRLIIPYRPEQFAQIATGIDGGGINGMRAQT